MDINDSEKNKFQLDGSKVAINTVNSIQGIDDIWNRNLNDLEKDKFDNNNNIRTVTAI